MDNKVSRVPTVYVFVVSRARALLEGMDLLLYFIDLPSPRRILPLSAFQALDDRAGQSCGVYVEGGAE